MGKARKIEREEGAKQCELCYLLESTNPKSKFHIYQYGSYFSQDHKYVCDGCLTQIRDIHEMCIEQCKHPEKEIITDKLNFWWIKKPEDENSSAMLLSAPAEK